MKQSNFVAKYARQFNKATVQINKKKRAKNGYIKYNKRISFER